MGREKIFQVDTCRSFIDGGETYRGFKKKIEFQKTNKKLTNDDRWSSNWWFVFNEEKIFTLNCMNK